jgi:hypothetical protein
MRAIDCFPTATNNSKPATFWLLKSLQEPGGRAEMADTISKGLPVTVILGSQWGDEGKGKLADILSAQSDVCARSAGGNNAGHTIVVDKVKYDFHLVPSGKFNFMHEKY